MNHTFCYDCQHMDRGNLFRRMLGSEFWICREDPHLNFATGKLKYLDCDIKNDGKCPDFEAKGVKK